MMKIEITKEKKQDAKFKRSGGEPQDYLAILSEAIASICKEEGFPMDVAIKGLFHELGGDSARLKFKGKPIDFEFEGDGTWPAWLEEILEEDGYVHGYYVDGYIVGDVVDATDEWINLSFWCPVDKDSVEVVK